MTLLDHHKTAFELMEQWKSENSLPQNCTPVSNALGRNAANWFTAVDYQLINEKSGATIAYDYFSKDHTLIADEADRAR